ncbi:MAG TPA: neutral zinc metallopeptidase [Actinomycetales bacterium]|nr:neutral zinc metallopeptidase [Actinomycetales bacterium]
MSFNENARLDTSQVQRGGGGLGGGFGKIGGGIGGILLLLVGAYFGVDLSGLTAGDPGSSVTTPGQQSDLAKECQTGADANQRADCRVVGTVNSVQDFWLDALPQQADVEYRRASTVIYTDRTQSACGPASNAVGPFYCPTDGKVYIDPSFFDELTTRFGADDGALAQEYVVAHEYGHHVQDLLGVLGAAQQDPQGAESGSVRVELMADCLAGVWANHAASTQDASGQTYLKPLTQNDIRSALSAAAAVGDDHIQQQAQGRVNQETWTHGSSAERQRWFTRGYQSGDLNQCDTLHASSL